MHLVRRTLALLVVPLAATLAPTPANAASYSAPLTTAIADLPLAAGTTSTRPGLRQRPRRLPFPVGVTDSVNQAKGDQDVAEWLPTYDRCRYLREFVAVKHRWQLSVDSAEKSAMQSLASTCTDSTITVTLAR